MSQASACFVLTLFPNKKQGNQSYEAKQQMLEKRFASELAAIEDETNELVEQYHQNM